MRWQRWYGVAFGMVGVMLQSHVYANTSLNSANQGWIVSQQTPNHPTWLLGDAKQMPARVPLGSLWKLWVYTYSVDQHVADRPYACHAGTQAATGDEYCCTMMSRSVAMWRWCARVARTSSHSVCRYRPKTGSATGSSKRQMCHGCRIYLGYNPRRRCL